MMKPIPPAAQLTLGYFGTCWIATILWLAGLLLIMWRQHRKQTY